MENKIVELALDSFVANRGSAEKRLAELEGNISGHKHGFFCFRWSNCRRVEKEIQEIKVRTAEYREAEEGLKVGRYEKAIEVLGRIAGQIDGSPLEVAMRIAHSPPTLASILNSPSSMASRMRQARDYLISLQQNGNQMPEGA
ncbi:MAG: hypothetical protein ABH889_00660 [Candidatus Portnoybacteria bacterium]